MKNWLGSLTWLALLIAVGLATPALAQDFSAAVSSPPRPEEALAPASVVSYWTAERMRTATPLDRSLTAGPELAARQPVLEPLPLSPEESVLALSGLPGSTPQEVTDPAEVSRLLSEAGGLGQVEPLLGDAPFTFSRYQLFPEFPSSPDFMYRMFPYRLTGKLFFVIPGEGNFVCSASSVNSENRSVVWTAGHCVVSPTQGGPVWHTNFLFVPAYRGQASCALTAYGCWTSKAEFSTVGWALSGFFEYDHGALVADLGGKGTPARVGDRIGWLGFTANIAQAQHWHDHGYPQAAPFDGIHHQICTAQLAILDLPSGIPGFPQTSGIGCDQTGGSSGGPWVINFSGAPGPTNLLNSHNSYRYVSTVPPCIAFGHPCELELFGPYFGGAAVNVRDAAQAVPVP